MHLKNGLDATGQLCTILHLECFHVRTEGSSWSACRQHANPRGANLGLAANPRAGSRWARTLSGCLA